MSIILSHRFENLLTMIDATKCVTSYFFKLVCILFQRVLANFEFAVNGTVSTREMLKFAENEKENCNGNPLTSYALGHIISNVWSEKVKVVKRGEAEQRIFIYLNLKRKTKAIQNPTQGGNDFESLVNFEPPAGWTVTRNNMELCYLKVENTSFRNQREITELLVRLCPSQIKFGMKHHGLFVQYLKKHFNLGTILSLLNLQEQVALFLEFLSCSSICSGITITEEDGISAMIPHVIGNYRDLSNNNFHNV